MPVADLVVPHRYHAAGLSLTCNPIGDFDEAIAAMVLCSDGEIITRDRHFEKIPGLKVIRY